MPVVDRVVNARDGFVGMVVSMLVLTDFNVVVEVVIGVTVSAVSGIVAVVFIRNLYERDTF